MQSLSMALEMIFADVRRIRSVDAGKWTANEKAVMHMLNQLEQIAGAQVRKIRGIPNENWMPIERSIVEVVDILTEEFQPRSRTTAPS